MKPIILNMDGHNFIDYPFGGQLTFHKSLLSFKHSNIDIKLVGLTSDPKEIKGQWSSRSYTNLKYPFFPIAYLPRIERKHKIPISLRYTYGIARYRQSLLQSKETVVYSHNPEMLLPLLPCPNPLIYHVHGSPLHKALHSKYSLLRSELFRKLYFQQIGRLFHRVDQLIWVSKASLEEALPYFPNIEKKSIVLPNGVDLKQYKRSMEMSELRQKYSLPLYEPIAVFLGRISDLKGIDYILHSLSILYQRGVTCHLLIIGSGECEAALQKLTKELRLEQVVHWVGQKSPDQVSELLSCANFAVFASHSEGFPMALLECMACGLPVLSTDVGEIGNVVMDGKNGYLLSNRDQEAYVSAWSKLITNFPHFEEHALSTAKQFSLDAMITRFQGIMSSFA